MQVVLIFCRGRSGSYYLHSLLDGHSEVLSLPPAKSVRRFFHSTDLYWHCGGKAKCNESQLIDAFVNENPAIFDARGKSRGLGFDKMGIDQSEYLHVDAVKFRIELARELLSCRGVPSRREFFVAVHKAYESVLSAGASQRNEKKLIVYQLHDPFDESGIDETLSDFPDSIVIGAAHDPISSFVSLLFLKDSDRLSEVVLTGRYLYCYEMVILGWEKIRARFPKVPFYVQSLRRLHGSPHESTLDLAKWLKIGWEPCLLESTFNKMKWNGDRWSLGTGSPVRQERTEKVLNWLDRLVVRVLFRETGAICGYPNVSNCKALAVAMFLFLPSKLEYESLCRTLLDLKFYELFRWVYFWGRRVRVSYACLFRSMRPMDRFALVRAGDICAPR